MDELPPDLRRWRQLYRSLNGDGADNRFGCGVVVHNDAFPGQGHFRRADAGTLVWLLQGRGRYRDEHGREAQLEAGDAFFRHPGCTHESRGDHREAEWIEFFVHLPTASFAACYDCGLFSPGDLCWRLGRPRALMDQARELLRMMPDEAGVDTPTCHLAMLGFLHAARQQHRRQTASDDQQVLLQRACASLRSHLDQELSITLLAAELGVGFEWLRKALRRELGMSPAAYRRLQRMARAETLLAESDLPVTAIAEAIGYADCFAFSKAFKIHSGHSPRAWRQHIMNTTQ